MTPFVPSSLGSGTSFLGFASPVETPCDVNELASRLATALMEAADRKGIIAVVGLAIFQHFTSAQVLQWLNTSNRDWEDIGGILRTSQSHHGCATR